jgi:hypothetical protein
MKTKLTNGDTIETYTDETGTYSAKWQIGDKTGDCYQKADEVTSEVEAESPAFHEVVSSCGNVLRAEFKACRLEMDLEKTWLNIIDHESHCESCVIDADGDVVSESGETVTNHWTDADWASITNAVKNATTRTT